MASSLAKDEYRILVAVAVAIVVYGIFLLINEISIYQPRIPHLSWTLYRVVLAIIIIYIGLLLFKLAKRRVSTGKSDSLKPISFISITSSFVLVLLSTSTFVNLLYTAYPMYDVLLHPVYVHGRTYDNLLILPSEYRNLTFDYAEIKAFLFVIPSPYGEIWFTEKSEGGNIFKFQRDSDYLLQWSYETWIRPYSSFWQYVRGEEDWHVGGKLSYGKTICYADFIGTKFSSIGDAKMAESYLKLVLQDIVRDHFFVLKDIFFRPAKLTYYGRSSSASSGEMLEIALVFVDDNDHTYEFHRRASFGYLGG